MPTTQPTEQTLEERLKTKYFLTLRWCLKHQNLLANPADEEIWERLWKEEFYPPIDQELTAFAEHLKNYRWSSIAEGWAERYKELVNKQDIDHLLQEWREGKSK